MGGGGYLARGWVPAPDPAPRPAGLTGSPFWDGHQCAWLAGKPMAIRWRGETEHHPESLPKASPWSGLSLPAFRGGSNLKA